MSVEDQKKPEQPATSGTANAVETAKGHAPAPPQAPAKESAPVSEAKNSTPDDVTEAGTAAKAAADRPADGVAAAAVVAKSAPAAPAKPKDRMRPVRIWLWLLALMVFGMVVVGGATRLTESGLSITEWKPVTGVVPPMSAAEWTENFDKYKQIPQFKEKFSTMTMAQYKVIYFWEWGHRLLGRLLGVVFLLPFLFFLATRRISWGLFAKLSLIFALGALQGLIGWWMVKSGLSNRVDVAAERLAVHLTLAAITFIALIWLAMRLRIREPQPASWDLRGEATGLIVVILIQIGLGGLVAGAKAGLTYNTWPLMDGHLVPAISKLTSMKPLWLNFLENPTMLQFQHRMFAYLVVLMVLGHAFMAMQKMAHKKIVRRAWGMTVLVLLQAALGVLTLLYVLPAGKMPIYLALAHQAVAFVLLAMAVVHRAAMSIPGTATVGVSGSSGGSEQQVKSYKVEPAQVDDAAIAT